MSPRETNTGSSTRRRPSLSLRQRPRTAVHPPLPAKDLKFEQWKEPSLVEGCREHHGPVIEEMDHFPEAAPRRRGAKSFSSFRHPMEGLVALGRRLSVTIRSKSSKQALRVPGEEGDADKGHYHHVPGQPSHKQHIATGSWDARSQLTWSKDHINRRPSLNSVSALQGFYAPTASVPAPIPGNRLEPPILPDDMHAGAAARAAAAAQNELFKAERHALKPADTRVTQDSESGIGIDLRDHSEISGADLAILRVGKDHTTLRVMHWN